jgi:hypothetical protein
MKHEGYIPSNNNELRELDETLTRTQGSPEFGDVAPQLRGSGRGKLSTPYKSVLRFSPGAFADEPQTGPDCTSHAARNACDITRAVEMDLKGQPQDWIARGATEPIYGYRGHTGAGMNPTRAIFWVHRVGFLARQKYPFGDLSRYHFPIGDRWGRGGPPKAVRDAASEFPFRYEARIRSVEEARDAIANGYGLVIGSQYGNNGQRDSRGVSRRSGRWNHAMCVGACDDTGSDALFLILNSWGSWNRGGHPEWGPIPGGSFLTPSADMAWMIRTGECLAIGDFTGFPAKDLPDYGATTFLG